MDYEKRLRVVETRLRVISKQGIYARPAMSLFDTLLDVRKKYGVNAELYENGVVYHGVLQIMRAGKQEGDNLGLRVSGARCMDAVGYFLKRASDILVEDILSE